MNKKRPTQAQLERFRRAIAASAAVQDSDYDPVAAKNRVQAEVLEEIKDLSPEEEIAYWESVRLPGFDETDMAVSDTPPPESVAAS